MPEENLNITEYEGWQTKALLIGAALGALVGLGAAYLFVQRAKGGDGQPDLTPGEGVKLGLLLLGLLRQVAEMGEGDKGRK